MSKKFQSFNVNGLSGWKSGTGIQNYLISKCKDDDDRILEIIRCNNDKQYRCFRIFKEDELLDFIQENNATHEIIFKYPRRVYFDVDVKKGEQFNLFDFLQFLRVYISNDEVNVCGYKTIEAESYHITLSNTYFENDDERLKFKQYLIYLKDKMPEKFGIAGQSDSLLDTHVYSVTQAFKCIYQSKPGKPQQTIIKGCPIRDIKNTFVNSFIGEKRLPLFCNCGDSSIFKEFEVIGNTITKKKLPFNKTIDNKPIVPIIELPIISREEIETAKGLLELCPVYGNYGSDLGHSHRFRVLNFCFWNGLSFDDFSEWFKTSAIEEAYKYNRNELNLQFNFYDNIQHIEEEVIKRTEVNSHNFSNETIDRRLNKLQQSWNNLNKQEQYKISINSFKKYLGNFYAELATSDDIQTSRFLSSFNIKDKSKSTLFKLNNNFVDNSIFEEIDSKYLLFNICMGGGKTTATLKYLSEHNDKSFVWFAPRTTLVENVSARMTNEYNIKHVSHLRVGTNKKKLTQADKLIICNQSLHYLDEDKKFDIVVIDEIETVLNSWSDSKTHGENMETNFDRFYSLIKSAERVILLDAFITKKTLNFIDNLEHNYSRPEEITTIYSDKVPPYKKLIQNDDYSKTIDKMVFDIRQGKKIYIFYAFKTSKTTRDGILDLDYRIKRRIQELDEKDAVTDSEKLKIMKIDTKDYKKSLVYFAESKEKNDLGDVNKKWTESDYIITNTSITVGVNYEGIDYDKIYLLCSGSTGSPRDIIQTSMRIRKTKEDIIELFFFDVLNKDFLEYPSYYSESSPIFKKLIVDVYAEHHSDFVDSFKKFCDITNYDYSNCPILTNKMNIKKSEFINDLYESNMLIEYSKIPILDESTKELYENRIYERKATLVERLSIDKYYFDNHYYYLKKESRSFLWNFKGRNFIKGMDDIIIKSILKDNNVELLENINLKDFTISSNTLEIIKNKFSTTIKNTLINKIAIKAINNILGVNVIDSKRVSNDRANGYIFTDLFNTLNNIYKEHNEYIIEQQKNADIINKEIDATNFIDDIEPNFKLICFDNDIDYKQFLKYKNDNKPIPKEFKHYDLDL